MDRLGEVVEGIISRMPKSLSPLGDRFRAQHERVLGIIASFGRHPHRNAVLGRPSTLAEEAYIAKGDFPHVEKEQAAS